MRIITLSILACGSLLAGCSSEDANSGPAPGTGGSSAAGGSSGSGGSANTGGSSGSGGSSESAGSSGSGGSKADAAVDSGEENPQEGGTVDDSSVINPDPLAPCPRCVRVFDGKTWDGWEASPSTWTIVDGAMRGYAGTSRAAYTKKDYGSFRLVVTSRMNPKNGDHLGILFWGNRPTDPDKPQIDLAGWLQWMPPGVGMWDYHPPKHHGLTAERLAPAPADIEAWHTSEILFNLDKGTVRAAVDGVETTRYAWPYPTERTDPLTRIIPGPVAMMRHGGGASEYKDIFIEDQPTEDKFYTLKK